MQDFADASAQRWRLPCASSANWLSTDGYSAAEMILLAEARRHDLERWRCGFARTHPEHFRTRLGAHKPLPDWARTNERVAKHEISFARWATAQVSLFPDKCAWCKAKKNERILREAYGTAEVLPDMNIPRPEPPLDRNVWDHQDSL